LFNKIAIKRRQYAPENVVMAILAGQGGWHVKKSCIKDLSSTNTALLDLAGRVPEGYVECLHRNSTWLF
jgi:hypothetical protein